VRGAIAAALVLALALAAGPASALDPRLGLDNYHHTRWTAEDGVPPQIRSMAQTADGWLWLGTADGLYRFDGMRFARYPLPPGATLSRTRIEDLYAHANGNLYISYFGEGVTVLHPDGSTDDLPDSAEHPIGPVNAISVDADGSVWVIGTAIHHYSGGRWRTVDQGRHWVTGTQRSLLLDLDGRLWAASDQGVWRLDRARGRFERVARQGGGLAQAPDGGVWLLSDGAETALPLAPSAAHPARRQRPATAESRFAGLFDRDGTLWALRCRDSVCLVHDAATRGAGGLAPARDADARIGQSGALSGQQARMVLEDREGNVWIATRDGLDRFREKRLLLSGLPGPGGDYSLARDADGQAWAARRSTGVLYRLAPGAEPRPVPAPFASVIASGRDGALLVGGKRVIQRRTTRDGRALVEEIALPPGPDGKPADLHLLGILDDGKVLWTASRETGLIGWSGGKWLPRSAFRLPPKIYLSAAGIPGQLWLATGDHELVSYIRNDQREHLDRYDTRPLGMVSGIFPGPDLTLSGERGFAVLKDGRLRLLRVADAEVLRGVTGLAVTADGDRWLNGAAGVIHVRVADWRQAMRDPDAPLRYELFDALDGYPGQAVVDSRWPSALTVDGRNLWLVATGGVVRLDSADLRRNPVAPAPSIMSVVTDGGNYPVDHGTAALVRLPPGTEHFRVQYAAPSLRKPERVHFEYRMDGVDTHWQDAGPRRATSYTNIGPGDYLLRVRTVNEDGVVGRDEARLRLAVEPTLVQSTWFRVACALGLAALATALYCCRVRYLTRRLTERLQVKTAERERIARTLHDTFLQTVQGLMLRLDAVTTALPPGDRARGQLETVLDDASRAIGEGRDQLQELRAGDSHGVEDIMVDTAQRLAGIHGRRGFELRIVGERRALHPAVAEEAGDIAREALRNAFAHAGASRIVACLSYGRRALVLSVADNGQGLPQEVARAGYRSGHWGLIGMRERAARIGARLAIDSGARTGTTVRLEAPARQAYAD
jgi:signal transduction histidine kinase/ligand-binding sensor domain-containing protein